MLGSRAWVIRRIVDLHGGLRTSLDDDRLLAALIVRKFYSELLAIKIVIDISFDAIKALAYRKCRSCSLNLLIKRFKLNLVSPWTALSLKVADASIADARGNFLFKKHSCIHNITFVARYVACFCNVLLKYLLRKIALFFVYIFAPTAKFHLNSI